MKYKTYPKYKDPGVEWLGEIPEEWGLFKLKNLGTFSSSGIDKKIIEGEELVQMVNYMDIYGNPLKTIDNKRKLMTTSCPEWKISECNLKKGDLVFTPSSETSEDIGLSALILEDLRNTVFSYHVLRFRFDRPIDLGYKKYLCNNSFVLQQFSRASKGTTRQILNRLDFKNIVVVLPTLPEQRGIANFLDQKKTKIDKLVQKNKKLIRLLEEKRQAIIAQAVTKGLDLNVKMKDGEVKWLGKTPRHWKVMKLKFIADNIFSNVDKKTNEQEVPVRLCNYMDVYKNDYITNSIQFMDATASSIEIKKYKIGISDVLVTKDSETPDDIATPALVKEVSKNLVCGYHLALLRPRKNVILGEYLFWLFMSKSFNQHFEVSARGITRYGLSISAFNDVKVPLPSIKEQRSILALLKNISGKTNKLVSKLIEQNKKLEEYRQALISNVVTGKIKV